MKMVILFPFLLSSFWIEGQAFRLCDIMDTFIKPNNLCMCFLIDADQNGLEAINGSVFKENKMFVTQNWQNRIILGEKGPSLSQVIMMIKQDCIENGMKFRVLDDLDFWEEQIKCRLNQLISISVSLENLFNMIFHILDSNTALCLFQNQEYSDKLECMQLTIVPQLYQSCNMLDMIVNCSFTHLLQTVFTNSECISSFFKLQDFQALFQDCIISSAIGNIKDCFTFKVQQFLDGLAKRCELKNESIHDYFLCIIGEGWVNQTKKEMKLLQQKLISSKQFCQQNTQNKSCNNEVQIPPTK